jgi:hypothetical protein
MRTLRPALALFSLGLLAPVTAFAQALPPVEAPLPTMTAPPAVGEPLGPNDPCTTLSAIVNRPTVTNAVCTVRPKHIEIETGYQNTAFDGGGNAVQYPQTLIRIGTRIRALELLVTPPQLQRATASGIIASGSSDVGAGLKYLLGYTNRVSYSLQATFTAPTGSPQFSAGSTTSIYALQGGYILSPALSLTAGLQDQILASNGVQYGSFVPSLVLSATLPHALGVFGEVAQFTHALGSGSPTRTQYLGGFYYDIGQRMQADVEYGISPTVETGKYHYVGFGASYNF